MNMMGSKNLESTLTKLNANNGAHRVNNDLREGEDDGHHDQWNQSFNQEDEMVKKGTDPN
jgi:hypothetical protein